jgi:amidase
MALTGHIIRTGQGLGDPLTQVGPIARYVEDLFPLVRETAGPDGRDPAVVPMPLRNPGSVDIGALRVAYHTDNGVKAVSADVSTTVRNAAGALKGVAAKVEESCPKALASLMEFWMFPELADGCEWMKQVLREAGTTRWDPHIDWIAEYGTLSAVEFSHMYRQWHKYRADMTQYMNRYDVIVCPVNAQASWPSGFEMNLENLKSFTYTAAYNITGWPAAVVRCGTSSDGMPIGVQVVAHPWREDICLAVAKYLEMEFGGWKCPAI